MSSVPVSAFIFAQAAAPQQGGFPMSMLLVYGLLFAAMYFFMIAPQRKKQKEHEKMLKELKSGDEILTNGGIVGVVTNVKEDRFVVRIADDTKVEIFKGFVQQVIRRDGAETKS